MIGYFSNYYLWGEQARVRTKVYLVKKQQLLVLAERRECLISYGLHRNLIFICAQAKLSSGFVFDSLYQDLRVNLFEIGVLWDGVCLTGAQHRSAVSTRLASNNTEASCEQQSSSQMSHLVEQSSPSSPLHSFSKYLQLFFLLYVNFSISL